MSDILDIVALDGRVTRRSELRLEDFWTGFSFGAGFFETLLIRAGTPLFLDEHLARLRSSLLRYRNTVRAPLDGLLTPEAVASSIAACLMQSDALGPSFTGAAKLIASDAHLLLMFRPYDADAPRRLSISAADRTTYRRGDETLNHKSLSYFRQHQYGSDPIVFINEQNQLCETPVGNLFFLRGDHLVTPTLEAPCLPGVIRSVLLGNGRLGSDLTRVEADLELDGLRDVSGCVMTNSLQLATPVDSVLGFSMSRSDELATRLRAELVALALHE